MCSSALQSLAANKLRAFLTMLGILIGVASIIAIMAVGSGGQAAIVSTIESQRVQDTIQILPTELVQPGLPEPGQVLSFSEDDVSVVRQFPGVQHVDYSLYGSAPVSSQGKAFTASVEAGPSFLDEIGHFTPISGHMFGEADVIAHRRVVLISQSLAAKLFGSRNPVGQIVRINGQPLLVLGVTISTQPNLFAALLGTDYVYMPYTTCLDLFPWWTISEMDVEISPDANKAELSRRIVMALNIHAHDAQAFSDASGLLLGLEKTIGTVTRILTLIIGAIAGIALLVGGVGVMNIMLVSVTERTQEIGIRMSLGATRRVILTQFLIESVTITVIGGALGVLCGLMVAQGVRWVVHLPITVSWQAVVGSVLFSAVIGIACGLYPANKAASLNPIDALRYE
ncbi:MAG: ABC transporter permease [Alicyclobacillus sp.]|nr:ABC transporter permease [Alicyclobacillus sp.]